MVSASGRNGRTRRERQNADNLKAQRRQPCARCGQRIDYNLPSSHPQSFMAGHRKAWATHPHLREDPSNLQPEHSECGKRAQTNDELPSNVTSRRW